MEEDNLEILQGLKPGMDRETARTVLAKHKGDMQAAALSIIEEDTINTRQWPNNEFVTTGTNHTNPSVIQARANTPVAQELSQPQKTNDIIDLTGDDDLSRALQMSLQPQTSFGPSTRAPDPNWAVVPTTVSADVGMSQEDQSYARAIEASLHASIAEDTYEDLLPEDRVRPEGRPVALRSSAVSFCYASVLFQAFFSIPQVKDALLELFHIVKLDGSPLEENENIVASLLEVYTNISLTITSYILIDPVLTSMNVPSATRAMDDPGDLSATLYSGLTDGVERTLRAATSDEEKRRLFYFRYSNKKGPPDEKFDFDPLLDKVCVRVDLRGTPETMELTSCLSTQLESAHKPQWIVVASDVVAFHLVRHPPAAPIQGPQLNYLDSTNVEKTQFRYPRSMYLDPFMAENAEVVERKRSERKEMQADIQSLLTRKDALTWHAGRDILKDMRSALYYYEHVIPRETTTTDRNAELTDVAFKLRKTLVRIENELEALSTQIGQLKSKIESLFDDSLLQKHRYDLRAVLMHDGLFGRNDIYSYIFHEQSWWKIIDHHVVEVSEETVLTDTTGLHLNAGPYMLLYSRATEDKKVQDVPWPAAMKEQVKRDNLRLYNLLSPELASQVREQYELSPPTSPEIGVVTMDEGLPTYSNASHQDIMNTLPEH